LAIGDYLSIGEYCSLVMLIAQYHALSHEKYSTEVCGSDFIMCYLCHQICCKWL